MLRHVLTPEHHLLDPAAAHKAPAAPHITTGQLPNTSKSDPGIKILETIHGPIEEGRVIKIVRKSETAQEFVVYRLVTRG